MATVLILDKFKLSFAKAKKFNYIRQHEIDYLIEQDDQHRGIEWYIQESIALLSYSNMNEVCKEISQNSNLKSTCLLNEACFKICFTKK